jgi:hypothetical protein
MQFGPLLETIGTQMIKDPAFVPPLLMHVGPGEQALIPDMTHSSLFYVNCGPVG